MKRIKRQRPFLQAVFNQPSQRRHLLQHANRDQINALSEIILNLLRHRLPLTPPTMARLRRYKKVLRDVGKRRHSLKRRRERLMSQRGSGFWLGLRNACRCLF